MTRNIRVWDPLIRLFHWLLAICFAANALIVDPETAAHRWIGYAVAALVALRLLWGVIGTQHARFADFLPSLNASFGQLREIVTGRRRIHAGHSPLGALMIYNLLITLVGVSITGYMMTTVAFFGVEWVEEAHEALVTWAEISVAAHIAAVLIESARLRVNLPKAMITGYKEVQRDGP
jgi:cytochrome b